jgi:hypothetical protein
VRAPNCESRQLRGDCIDHSIYIHNGIGKFARCCGSPKTLRRIHKKPRAYYPIERTCGQKEFGLWNIT